MKWLFGKITGAAKVVAPIALAAAQPEALINNGVAAVVKHATKIDNQSIPGLNFLLSSGAAFVKAGIANGSWGAEGIMPAVMAGASVAAFSTGIHQTAKVAAKGTRFSGM